MKINRMSKRQLLKKIEELERKNDRSLYLSHLKRRLKTLS
jgi:hypothetical protein